MKRYKIIIFSAVMLAVMVFTSCDPEAEIKHSDDDVVTIYKKMNAILSSLTFLEDSNWKISGTGKGASLTLTMPYTISYVEDGIKDIYTISSCTIICNEYQTVENYNITRETIFKYNGQIHNMFEAIYVADGGGHLEDFYFDETQYEPDILKPQTVDL